MNLIFQLNLILLFEHSELKKIAITVLMFNKVVGDMQKIKHLKQLMRLNEQPITKFNFITFDLKFNLFRHFLINYSIHY